ncbi:tail lysin protein [Bacillus phage Bubs]|uniref:tail protein with lysin activity n=1 Tax=Bacillus phage Nemo TaxID=1805950 RepID=UPI0007A76B77|nr:tail protein with lysin activity [Bacillus phage Nemo]AMW63583.1 tail lysin [Bacillus phage Nemo]ASR78751.1 tail lysin protein [Bacillus phage Bubs]
MTTIVARYPRIEVDLITEKTTYEIQYDTGETLTTKNFDNAILSLSTKNAMADDSPAFSLIVTAQDKWDKVIGPNDLIRIKAIPDVTDAVPDNPWIMVGLISDIKKDGEYANGTLVYRVTGQAMTKALINFQVGVIQQFASISPDIGWLPDGTEQGLKFSGNNAAGIGNELMDRFLYKYAQYEFANGTGLQDYFTHEFKSWESDESLQDPSPFVNYQGSMRQFLEDIVAKPFNELYFEFTKDGRCIALMRPTPFDKDKWDALHSYEITSDIVLQESYSRNDNEAFSVYCVDAPNIAEFTSLDLGVYPRFHPELIKKYGYKRLDASNRYLLSTNKAQSGNVNTGNAANNTGNTAKQPTYDELLLYINQQGFMDKETIRKKKSEMSASLKAQFPSMTVSMTNNIIDAIADEKFNPDKYKQIISSATGDVNQSNNNEKSADSTKLKAFTDRLYNWYCENPNFYSGDIRVLGNPAFRVGAKLYYEDFEQETKWEFYIESIQHEFSYTNGYSTIIGVTRGLQNRGASRFTNLWGKSEDFKGGYLGEDTLATLLEKAKAAREAQMANGGQGGNTGGTGGVVAGGPVAMNAVAIAKEMTTKPSIYVFGGGRSGGNPFTKSPIKTDCSSFIWWIFNLNGVDLKGGEHGMTTDTIKTDSRLQTIGSRGSDKAQVKAQMQVGDLIWFDTYKTDGHIVIYTGNGKFIGSQDKGITEEDLGSSYWDRVFKGHVKRFVG